MHWNKIGKSFLKNLGSESAISAISPNTSVLLFDYFINNNQVKFHFFKTFILPYYDYCSSLIIYYSKLALDKYIQSF